MMKPQVGQRVFLKPLNNQLRMGTKEIKERIVRKVGRKYFEVWDGQREYSVIKFNLEDHRQVTEYCEDWVLYFDMQEIVDEDERSNLTDAIRKVFGGYGTPKLTLDQLRQINVIIKEEQ